MKKILLTGGGTAGHVMPHLALLPLLKDKHYSIDYMGSYSGIEKKLIEKEGIPYYGIASGKLRRYFDWKNLSDVFRIIYGTIQATIRIKKIKPNLVFSKGGFVTVPVIIGAWLNKVPVIIHESDMTPGLANKIALRFALKVCTTFEPTLQYLPKSKTVYTGAPIRPEILEGNLEKGFAFTLLDRDKETLLLTGGSLGAKSMNAILRASLTTLTKDYNVIHLCGKGNLDHSYMTMDSYRQYEFIDEGLPDLMAMSDYVISRAGSNTITELLALKKPNLLIPLPSAQSRGDQLINAGFFEKAGYSLVLQEEYLTPDSLIDALESLKSHAPDYIEAMKHSKGADGAKNLLTIIETCLK